MYIIRQRRYIINAKGVASSFVPIHVCESKHILLYGHKRAAWCYRTILAFCERPRSNLHSFACKRACRLSSFDYHAQHVAHITNGNAVLYHDRRSISLHRRWTNYTPCEPHLCEVVLRTLFCSSQNARGALCTLMPPSPREGDREAVEGVSLRLLIFRPIS